MKHISSRFISSSVIVTVLLASASALAEVTESFKTRSGTARYIVLLDDPSLVEELVAEESRSPQSSEFRDPRGKLDLRSGLVRNRMTRMDERFAEVEAEISLNLGRDLAPVHRYRAAVNGFSARLSDKEALRLAKMKGVKSIRLDERFKLETYAGPNWIGADRVWAGEGFVPANRGAGVVVGIIDSGTNWTHPSFDDPGDGSPIDTPGQHDHENPYGEELGLCSDEEVLCNDKLVGVYDFVEDDPDTDVVEEFNNGADNGTHGAHTASTAAGNPIGFVLGNGAPLNLSGVAPDANIISYRVCYEGDPEDPEDDACQGSAILKAIDQAILDGVDVINYSIGGGAFNPWASADTLAYLNAVDAGIFVATSAGNSGPAPGTMGRPANAPWITAVGSSTHDGVLATILKTTDGGDTEPPGDLVGESLTTEGVSPTRIVHAKDFGNALCGVGEAELQADCDGNTGATNPFEPGTFNGEIVVCDRGTYGRVEKGKNLLLAGAGGYVLANTASQSEDTTFDAHCLPATHIGESDGDKLRTWLDSGSDHTASLTGFLLFNSGEVADQMSGFSSRGPNPSPAEDVLKPNLIAPGDLILAADNDSNGVIFLGGTSMASPHVAGAAALLLAERPDLSPTQVQSILELTATDAFAKDENFGSATHFDTGSGRPRVYDAVSAGIFLEESTENFLAANPANGGDPSELNLASLTDDNCADVCSFTRRIGTLVNGRSWTVTSSGFPDGAEVTITPDSFAILEGSPQEIEITIDLTGLELKDQWIFGKLHIDNPNYPQSTLPVSVFASTGELPERWDIPTPSNSGFQDLGLQGLVGFSEATYTAGGLSPQDVTRVDLVEDPTFQDPYDGGEGVFTVLLDVPAGALLLQASTPETPLPDNDNLYADDLDLFVGFDSNKDGKAQESETICISADFDAIEECLVQQPRAGIWWVLVQNWEDGVDSPGPAQEVTLITAVVDDDESSLTATGPSILEAQSDFDVRVAWSDVAALPGETLVGAVAVGSSSDTPRDVGVIPVFIERTSVEAPGTIALMDGQGSRFALDANTDHAGIFIDVPPGASSLEVTATGDSSGESDALTLDLVRVDFNEAFSNAPFAAPLPGNATPVASDSGSSGNGPSVSISGSALQAGRWHAVVRNGSGEAVRVTVEANLAHGGTPVNVAGGLWAPTSRPNINQGFEYTPAGSNRAFLWYTYDRDGSAVWYIAAAPETSGNSWTAGLLRFTNDGARQQGTIVGDVSVTMLDENDAVFSWNLFGESGSDRVGPLSRSCPEVAGQPQNYTGLWYRGSDGLGGASVIANRNSQAQIHYLYDGRGMPRWLLGAGKFTESELPLQQFNGFCPTCQGSVTAGDVGVLDVSFDEVDEGSWTLDYLFTSPATGGVTRTDSTVKLSNPLVCVQ